MDVTAGVDMGGTKIQTAIVRAGKAIGQARLPTPRAGRHRCSRRCRRRWLSWFVAWALVLVVGVLAGWLLHQLNASWSTPYARILIFPLAVLSAGVLIQGVRWALVLRLAQTATLGALSGSIPTEASKPQRPRKLAWPVRPADYDLIAPLLIGVVAYLVFAPMVRP